MKKFIVIATLGLFVIASVGFAADAVKTDVNPATKVTEVKKTEKAEVKAEVKAEKKAEKKAWKKAKKAKKAETKAEVKATESATTK